MTNEEDQKQKEALAKKMSNYELQKALESQTHSGDWHKTALKEILRRKEEKDKKDDHRQSRIEYYTFVILILTIFLAVLALRECFH
ncbi:MAG: hypothetical protein C0417_13175 [Chlorobiaceae bacterium]|nr:hypothetical protein [Chlorobiaceae bacterium]